LAAKNKPSLEDIQKIFPENLLYEAAVPFEKRDMFKEDINAKIIIDNGCLIFKEGDESILPEEWKEWI